MTTPAHRHKYPRHVLAIVMAGGQGSRLMPLTETRSKPAVPFGSRYHIIDFVLSNLVNSGIFTIYLLVQYKSQSLIEHIRNAWTISPLFPEQFVTVVPPQMREGPNWFQGTADAVTQNMNLIIAHHPELVLVFGADHVYRMDVTQMVEFHLERSADITVAALPVPIERASDFGVIKVDAEGRILDFQEKPERPSHIPGDPSRAYASMGNYLFHSACLLSSLREARRLGDTDFGTHVLPRVIKDHRIFAYDFATNEIPGIKRHEEASYWRDVGTVDAYFEAHRDLLGLAPRFDVFNPQWPIFSSNYQGPVSRVIRGDIDNSLLGSATLINGAKIRNSIIRREAIVEEGAKLEDCVIMDYVRIGRGARLRRTIVDRHNVVDEGERIGHDPEADAERYTVSPSGVVVVSRGYGPYYPRGGRGFSIGYGE
jgi:glucose-1-phosphate adenylyltransferase